MSTEFKDGEREAAPGSERRLMGSLRDALIAAAAPSKPPAASPPPLPPMSEAKAAVSLGKEAGVSAADAVRETRSGALSKAEASATELDIPQTKVARAAFTRPAAREGGARTQLIRGKISVKRTDFFQDPVVGWLVVVGGLGLGAFRPIFEGNNTIGRAKGQRIPIDFGDETISGEEQAYIRYDSVDRKFLLVPNLSKTNIVAVNNRKPTGAVELEPMDLITMGRTQLVFVPFCGTDFDWAELSEMKS